VAVQGNPLENVQLLETPAVIQGGAVVKRN